jgi:uncharacterized protein YdaU (DUF1376 family)
MGRDVVANNGNSSRRPHPWRRQFYQEELVFTRELTAEEVGVYYILSLLAWQKGGELPMDTKRLASMTHFQQSLIARALERFRELEIISLENGSLCIYHIDREIKHASKRSAAGATGASSRWGGGSD